MRQNPANDWPAELIEACLVGFRTNLRVSTTATIRVVLDAALAYRDDTGAPVLVRVDSWSGLKAAIDTRFPPDVFDGSSGDPGPTIIVLMRQIAAAEERADRNAQAVDAENRRAVAAAEAYCDALRAELEQRKASAIAYMKSGGRLSEQLHRAEARVAALTEALRTYGQHALTCAHRTTRTAEWDAERQSMVAGWTRADCDCGLAALLDGSDG